MIAFIVRRLAVSIPLVLASSFIVFLLVASAADPLEELRLNPRISEEVIEARERELNLDKPLFERYGIWLGNAVQGDFGEDNQGSDVAPQLTRALGTTLRLVIVAIFIAVVLALIAGVISAVRQYSWFDYSSTFAAFLFYSLPVFWLAVLLKEFAAIRLNNVLEGWGFSRWIATVGSQSATFNGSFMARIGDIAGHTFLPALTLILVSFAAYSRYTRSSMLETLNSDYVRTAEAKGIPRSQVIRKHALRNALIPVTTVVALDFSAVIGGAIVTERVFNWRGMGTLLIDAVTAADVNVVQAWLLVTAIVVVVFNLLADVLYALLDPRIRLD
ncbi:ABC transporter permease [Actinomarinicola tropica]|uniref:ABC transporter permease subunit n=1 Tax=Actinomarinicola tropica TaxID=2789776 RepID=A0A5Q2RLJ5_9ACTN|nr:ABC transporter permease [Actinomarinicola tropica]QGG95451.1 ABC transporter permease subunit [Actinomarinicola tropica]